MKPRIELELSTIVGRAIHPMRDAADPTSAQSTFDLVASMHARIREVAKEDGLVVLVMEPPVRDDSQREVYVRFELCLPIYEKALRKTLRVPKLRLPKAAL